MKKVYVLLFMLLMCFMVACKDTQKIDVDKEGTSSETKTTEVAENSEDESISEDAESSDAEKVAHVADWEYTEWEEGRKVKTGDSIQLGVIQVYQGNTYLMRVDSHDANCRWFVGENSLSAVLKEADGSETELIIYKFCLTDEYMVFASRLEGDPDYYDSRDALRIFVKEQDGNVRQIAEKIQDAYVDSGKLIALNTENYVQIFDLASGNMEKQIQLEDEIRMQYMCCEYLVYTNENGDLVHYYMESGLSDIVSFTYAKKRYYDYFVQQGNVYGNNSQDDYLVLLYEQGKRTTGVIEAPFSYYQVVDSILFGCNRYRVFMYDYLLDQEKILYSLNDDEENNNVYLEYSCKEKVILSKYSFEDCKEYYIEVDLEGNVKIIGEVQLDPNI